MRGAFGVVLAVLAFALTGTAQAQAAQSVVDVDAATGTPRMLAKLDGTLTRASSRSPSAIARDYVRAKLPPLDLGSPTVTSAGGITSVAWRQSVDGVGASDRSLRVNLDADGRVLNVLGAPDPDLTLSTTPSVDAGEALRAVQDDVGVHRPLVRRGGTARRVDFGSNTSARLVTYSGRLAWRVRYRAAGDAIYDATVDARTGDVLRRVNMVKSEAPALVWERYPGFGSAATVDLEARGYLAADATMLLGPYVHAFSDVNDNDVASASEEVTRTAGGFTFPLTPATGTGCGDTSLCSWTGSGTTWQANREQDTVQAFYLANRFRDHLATLGFDGFSGADRVLLHTLDGAATGPDTDHVNNANMFTPPEGESPIMQMYLWRSPFRTVSSGSDAAVLLHEYTHGLSNRLVVDADGIGALNTAQAGAMGEGWSDWYAQDFLVSQFPALDTGAAGEVDMGAYVNASSRLRSSPIDCPVGASPVACPGRGAAGSGGYTYGDFGQVFGSPEVHYDGEIWAQTLWDLRTALGGEKARALVTAGMRLLPPEPSFLEARNGILLADQALYGGADVGAIWGVFAARGMGFFAAALGGEDTSPAEDFSLPPGPEAPRGTVSGRVTAALGGAPVAGVTVGLGGVSGYTATTDADGRFTVPGVPAGTYLKAWAGGAGWDFTSSSLAVPGGGTIEFNPVLRRNWASASGGAVVTDSNGREYTSNGCGPSAALDQSLGTAWSTTAGAGEKYLVVRLPSATDITQFGLDPAEGCGDTAASATAAYMVETSVDGTEWTTAVNSVFTSAHRHQLNFVTPGAGANGVRFVRLSLLSSQGFGAPFRDLSEFGVYGRTAGADTVDPETTLDPGGPPFTFSSNEPGTFECRVDTGEWALCTSPHTVALPDGEHTFSVRAVDVAGNRDATPASRTFVVDTAAPETTLEAGGPPFVFSSEAGATFECKLDAGDYAPCTSPHTVTLPDGEHTFSVRAVDAAGNRDATPATRTFVVDSTAPDTGFVGLQPALTRDDTPSFAFASSPPGATFECRVDDGPWEPCTSPHTTAVLADGRHLFAVRAVDGPADPTPAVHTFRVDTTAPTTAITSGPPATIHSGPIAFGVGADEDATFECALDDGDYGSCAVTYRAEDLSLGKHVFRARATDQAGNLDATPAEHPFTIVNAAPVPALTLDSATGTAPHTATFGVAATDADGDRLTYTLDFGDGQSATSASPGSIAHRYDAPGTHIARLTVRDARVARTADVTLTVTALQPAPGLSLQLSTTAVDLGTFVPGVTRDYTGTLTATTTGNGTLTVSDGGSSPGRLLSGSTALARALEVRNTAGAFTPLSGAVAIPNSVEFRQRIEAGDVLRRGDYSKTLTFTLSAGKP